MVIRPWGMAVWDAFRDDMDKVSKQNGSFRNVQVVEVFNLDVLWRI